MVIQAVELWLFSGSRIRCVFFCNFHLGVHAWVCLVDEIIFQSSVFFLQSKTNIYMSQTYLFNVIFVSVHAIWLSVCVQCAFAIIIKVAEGTTVVTVSQPWRFRNRGYGSK